MKRKRDLLYDVFGGGDLQNATRSATPRSPSPPSAKRSAPPPGAKRSAPYPREFRVSREFGVVLLVLSVVFVGTSYYLGRLGGKRAGDDAPLSTRTSRTPSGATPSGGTGSGETGVEPYWSVRVFTDTWPAKDGPAKAETNVHKVCDFLEREGFKDVLPLKDSEKRQIVIFVGRSEDPVKLEPDRNRLRKLAYGSGRPFEDAVIYKVDFPIKPPL